MVKSRPNIPLPLGNKSDEARELSAWWSFLDVLYILLQSCGAGWCPLPYAGHRKKKNQKKNLVHLIGFLDSGFVLPFLPAEIGFTWQD